MISPEHISAMARYNAWQNRSLYGAADGLSDAARRQDRGAYFKSIQATLNHLLWGDQQWLSRLANTPKPVVGAHRSMVAIEDWDDLKRARVAFDQVMSDWAQAISAEWLKGDLTWHSGAAGKELTRPRWLLVTHLFNHQTHHRGQVHAMLTAAGVKPDDTDLMLLTV